MRIKILTIFALTVLFFIQCNHPAETSQWRGPNRDGVYPDKNLMKQWPANGPALLWEYDSLGVGYSSVAATSELVYTAGTNKQDSISYVFAFNHQGKLQWKTKLGKEWMRGYLGIRSTPLISDGKGYLMNGLGELFCFDAKTGEIIWSKNFMKENDAPNIMHGFCQNLIIDNKILYCIPGAKKLNVAALNAENGEFIWTSEGNGETSSYGAPIIIERGGKRFLVTLTFNSLMAVELDNGKLVWNMNLKEANYGIHANTPLYSDGYLFAIDGWSYGANMLTLAEDGMSYQKIWTNDSLDAQLGDAIKIGDRIYTGSGSHGGWYCADWKTGNILYKTRDVGEGTIMAADDLLYLYSYDGKMALVKPENDHFTVISQFQVGNTKSDHFSYPVLQNGRLYIRHYEKMWVYDVSANN